MKSLLFSYGTLQNENIQLDIFGRILKGKIDKIYRFKLKSILIKVALEIKEEFLIAVNSDAENDFIESFIYEILEEELIKVDEYEGEDYQRVLKTLNSGKKAWVYVQNK